MNLYDLIASFAYQQPEARSVYAPSQRETLGGGLLSPNVALDPYGFPVDLTRPIVKDEEEIKTEFTETVKIGDRFYNIPTVWGGKAYDWEKDKNYILGRVTDYLSVGGQIPNFSTLEEAIKAAPIRSEFIGQLRWKELEQ